MSFEQSLLNLVQNQDILDNAKILSELQNPKNINMKTHIVSPVEFALLDALISFLKNSIEILKKKRQLKKFVKFLEDFVKALKELLVSWNRQSRKEITETISGQINKQNVSRTAIERLIGVG